MSDLKLLPAGNTVIFLHIPKTAGSTLHTLFDTRVRREASRGIFAADLDHEAVKALASEPDAQKRKIKLLRGHQPFGLHTVLPQPCSYVTVLRHPVARAISQYFYVLKNAHNPLHDQVRKMRSPGEFVESGISVGMNDGQVRWLQGGVHALGFGEVTPDHLEEAKRNIEEHFLCVGLTERFDDSILVLRHVLRWRTPPFYRRQNVNARKRAVADEDRERIQRHNQLDLELYEFAERLLDQQMAAADLDGNSVRRFQRANLVFSRLRWPQDLVTPSVRAAARRFIRPA